MSTVEKFHICGEVHHRYPALIFPYPNAYYWLTEEQKNTLNIHIDGDFCTIEYPERTDHFIRVLLRQKIAKSSLYLDYGLWVAVSKEDYEDYSAHFNSVDHERMYFGWLSNAVPGYQFEKSIPLDVKTKRGNERPEIYPHLDLSHPFVKDYYEGIPKDEAEKRIHGKRPNISLHK